MDTATALEQTAEVYSPQKIHTNGTVKTKGVRPKKPNSLPTDPQPGTPLTVEEYKNLRTLWKKLAATRLSTNRDHLLYSILSGKDLFRVFTPYRNSRKLVHLAPYETLIRQVQHVKEWLEYELFKGKASEIKFHIWAPESFQSSPTIHQFIVDKCEATLQSLKHQATKTLELLS